MDSEHVSGKAILKDFEDMYKQHPDWLMKKQHKKTDNDDQDIEVIKKVKKDKKSIKVEEDAKVDDLDANQLALDSDEICKYNTPLFLREHHPWRLL